MAEKIAPMAPRSRGMAAPAPPAFLSPYPLAVVSTWGSLMWETGSHKLHLPGQGGLGT